MKRILCILALALVLASCEDTIDFIGDESQSMVVLNAMAEADSALTARVTLSRFFLSGTPFQTVSDALLTLTINGTSYSAINGGNGNYHFDCHPQEGDSISLSCQVPGFDLVMAHTRMPVSVPVQVLSAEFDPNYSEVVDNFWNDSYNGAFRLKLRFSDPAGQGNYYRLRIVGNDTILYWDYTYNYSTGTYTDSTLSTCVNHCESFTINDPAIVSNTNMEGLIGGDASDVSTFKGNELIFTDERIDGQSHDLDVVLSLSFWNQIHELSGQVTVTLESLSRDYYLYLLTKASQNSESEFGGLGSEPTAIISNVEGGLGILAAKSSSINTQNITYQADPEE